MRVSYCRWSDMGYQCDLYVYAEDDGGWTVHVARQRAVEPVTDIVEQKSALMRRIGLSRDGKTLKFATAGECAEAIRGLLREGYSAPVSLIPTLWAEHEADEDEDEAETG